MGQKYESVAWDDLPYWSDEMLMEQTPMMRKWLIEQFKASNNWSRHIWADVWINHAHPENNPPLKGQQEERGW